MIFQIVGVVGAGVMGTGVAQVLLQTGHNVVLVDVSGAILDKSITAIRNGIRMQIMFNPTLKGLDIDEIISRVKISTTVEDLSEVQFLIENVSEKWDIKTNVYRLIDTICPPDCIFAANTSALSLTKIANITNRADKVIGMHFMNPVPMRKLVETVRGFHTSEDTIQKSIQFLQQMNKECVLVNDLPGFVSNRISHLFMNEAIWVVQDNVAPPEAVDQIFKEGYRHEVGPLETADLIGLDVVLDTLNVLFESYQDPKFRAAPLLRKMVDAGLLGRKSGQGFYRY